MSLIEQAANRLEQLRQAGSQVSGDLAYPADGEQSANDHAEVDRLILPLTRDGGTVDQLLGMTIAIGGAPRRF